MNLTFTADTNREGSYACLIEPATNLKECVFKLGTKLSTSPPKEDEASSGGVDTGIIIGIVVGVVSFLAILIFIAWKVIRKRKPIKELFCCCCASTDRPKHSDSNVQQPPSTPIYTDPTTSSTRASPNPTGGTPSVEEAQALLKDDQPNTDAFVNSSGQAGGNPYAHIKNGSGLATQWSNPNSPTANPQQQDDPFGENKSSDSDVRKINKLIEKILKQTPVDTLDGPKDYSVEQEDNNVTAKKSKKNGSSSATNHHTADIHQGTELHTSPPSLTSPLSLRWPSLSDLTGLKEFIKTTLVPLFGNRTYPRHDQDQAERELQEMRRLKVEINVKLDNFRALDLSRQGACSMQMLKDKEKLAKKLETLEEVAKLRIDNLQKIIDDMMKSRAHESYGQEQIERHLMRLHSTGADDPAEAETPKTVVRVPPTRRVFDLTVDDLDLNKFEQTSSAEEHPARP